MSYLGPDFEYDLFISYASGDSDGDGKSRLKDWSLKFANGLQEELKAKAPFQDFELFIDSNRKTSGAIDPHAALTLEIRNALRKAALILYIVSPQYLESKWCDFERAEWIKNKTTSFPEADGRHFFVTTELLEKEKWPREFLDELGEPPLGARFFDPAVDVLYSAPYGWTQSPASDALFNEELVKLRGRIGVALKEVRKGLERRREAQAAIERLRYEGGQQLFVNAKQRDLARWDASVKALLQAGFGVFPGAPEGDTVDPKTGQESEKLLVQTLSECDGLLIVIGESAPSLPFELARARNRRNLARALSNRPLPCAVLDHGVQIENKALLQASARNLDIVWIDAQRTQWSHAIHNWLRETSQRLET